LPLFLELVSRISRGNPALAADALAGLRAYQHASRSSASPQRPAIIRREGASLRDCGGTGAPIVLVPSLINPPNILDLDADCSLGEALKGEGRVLLLDWGPARSRPLSLTGHVEDLLVPMLRDLGAPAALVGYCLGGTLSLAAASRVASSGVATLAAPWHFDRYPADTRSAIARLRDQAWPSAEALEALPMEVLQAAFWSLDPERTVAKFAAFGAMDPSGPQARRFVTLEDWANAGEPLPLPAAAELVDDLFGADRPGGGNWFELPATPLLHFTAANDRIVPAPTVALGETIAIASGHVGMIVGRQAPVLLHRPLKEWLRQR